MTKTRHLAVAVAAAVGISVVPAAADLTTQAGEAGNRLYAAGRGLDEAANPAFMRNYTARDDGQWIDPYRRDWSGSRGVMREVRFPNRYGASLRALQLRPELPWRDPVTGRTYDGHLPAIVVVVGFGGAAEDYLTEGQQLAENGYVVLIVEPQGDHLSDVHPSPEYCDPGGSWRQPQEAGLTEQGPCAGEDAADVDNPMDPTVAALLRPLHDTALYPAVSTPAALAYPREDPAGARDGAAAAYDVFRARYTFGAIDAATWLVSAADGWSSLIDARRVGVAGHSAGADAAVVAGNAANHHLFRAAEAWDTYGIPPTGVTPTVPTMWQQSEQEDLYGPWAPLPDPEFWNSYTALHHWETARVPAYELALRGSTHNEWVWTPDAVHSTAQGVPPIFNASAEGSQVALYYALAWFDLWLKGAGNPAVAADAERRLTATVFDDSADRSSIGAGTYDPSTDSNVPYTLAGEPVSDHLSRLFRSEYSFDGHACADVLAGC